MLRRVWKHVTGNGIKLISRVPLRLTIVKEVMTSFIRDTEKDVFEKYYKQHLAKRILLGKTTSNDAERSLIVKLKTEYGYQFNSKLESMFTNMKTADDTIQGFYACHGAELRG
ncbi:hypothetical protein VNO77_19841 [Canavalia gladiata]|uniref:Cullin family profile domain-containing protein n=1 Tax=Canavalia gladiata TaxID=3824 RepID=A0AAN9LTB4_CANGL